MHTIYVPIPHFNVLAVTGHGIPQETIDNLLAVMEAYFSLPLETKMKVIGLLGQFLDFCLRFESSFIGNSGPVAKDMLPCWIPT